MQERKYYPLVAAGFMTSLGLILPWVTSHAFGVPGTILLPMHIPILLCGLLCGPKYGALCGAIVPVISSILTGMPPAYPMLPIMFVQLVVLGFVSGLLYKRLKQNMYLSLLAAMLAGWLSYGAVFAALMLAGNGRMQALSVTAALVKGLPGIVIQMSLVPALVFAANRVLKGNTGLLNEQDDKIVESARSLIKSDGISCVVIKGARIIHTADGRGVSPLLALFKNEPEKLNGAFVVDTIIGKAAAMILLLGGVREVYGEVMSLAAKEFLEKHGVKIRYGRCVDIIASRDGRGICPIEKSVLDIDDPSEGYAALCKRLDELSKAG